MADDRYVRARKLGATPVESTAMLVRHAAIRESAGMDWDAQREPLERAAALDATDPVLRALAFGWDRRGDAEHALAAYENVLAQAPEDSGVLLRVAQLREQTVDSAGAMTAYEAVLALDPASTSARLGLASLHEEAGNIADAEAIYRGLTEAHPDNVGAWRKLLKFYKRTGNTDAAGEVRGEMERRWPKASTRKRPLR